MSESIIEKMKMHFDMSKKKRNEKGKTIIEEIRNQYKNLALNSSLDLKSQENREDKPGKNLEIEELKSPELPKNSDSINIDSGNKQNQISDYIMQILKVAEKTKLSKRKFYKKKNAIKLKR